MKFSGSLRGKGSIMLLREQHAGKCATLVFIQSGLSKDSCKHSVTNYTEDGGPGAI